MKLNVTVNGVEYEVDVEVQEPQTPSVEHIIIGAGAGTGPVLSAPAAAGQADGIAAPLAGTVFKILVEEGQAVKKDDVLIILEAMKMETEIVADRDGTVEKIHVAVRDAVQAGQGLIKLEYGEA